MGNAINPVKKAGPVANGNSKKNGNQTGAARKPANSAAKQSGKNSDGAGQLMHGAEALAALVVSEKKNARLKGKIILGLMLVLCFSLAWNSVQNWTRPEPKLLGMTNDGRVQPLPLLDEPIDSRQTLVDWSRRNIPPMYDFNYANYRGALNKNLDVMRPVTLQSFQKMLDASGILPKVREEFLILRANVADEPVILGEGVRDGVRVWIIELPLNLIYDSGDVKDGQRRRITQKIAFRAWIARASPLEFDGGLMLAKFTVQPRRDDT